MVQHEEHGQRGCFFIIQDGQRIGELTYARISESRAVIDHTEVIPSLRGGGIAGELLDAAAKWARSSNIRLGATCSYAMARFARDPSFRDVQG